MNVARGSARAVAIWPIAACRAPSLAYSSSMCSIAPASRLDGDLGRRLSAAIDELAAAATSASGPADDQELAARLAAAWAMIAAADPELANRAARYSR
jgi:hypothetical protein